MSLARDYSNFAVSLGEFFKPDVLFTPKVSLFGDYSGTLGGLGPKIQHFLLGAPADISDLPFLPSRTNFPGPFGG